MEWYEEDVQHVEKRIAELNYKPEMLFYGSSSIRLWEDLYEDFQPYYPVNLGFGGSTLEACVYFFDRIMQSFDPQQLVIYAGDNDLGDGKEPETVLHYFTQLCEAIDRRFPDVQIFYVSIKPSIARWDIHDKIQQTNQLIRDVIRDDYPHITFVDVYHRMIDAEGKPLPELYAEDGLHMSRAGYLIWKQTLTERFSTIVNDQLTKQQ